MRSRVCAQVGRRIRVLRRQQGLTQGDLARKAETTRESIVIIESGRRDMGLSALERIIRALGVSWVEFFEGM